MYLRTKIIFLVIFLQFVSVELIRCQAPNFQWAVNANGSDAENGECMTVDGNGNVIVGGHFFSSTVAFGTNTLSNFGTMDLFVTKYDAAGNVLWAKGGGGSFFDYANSIACDNAGNIYLCGNYYSPSITVSNNTLSSLGGSDGYIIKYDPLGNIVWTKNIGGDMDEMCNGITVDQTGNIYVTGAFKSASLVCESYTLNNTGVGNVFVAKYNSAGNIIWARSFEGDNDDAGKAIAVDVNENIFVTGSFKSSALIIDSYTLSNLGNTDVFVSKLNNLGNTLWANSAGGNFNDSGSEITLDAFGNVYIAGDFNSANMIVETYTLNNLGNFDFFIAKYDNSGNLLWAKAEGDINDEVCTGLTTDINANLYVTGHFHGVSMSLGTNTLINNGAFGGDLFISKHNTLGNVLWATSAGGGTDDGTSCMTSDFAGNIYVAGFFASANMVCSAFTLTSTGNADMFVGKLQSTITDLSNSSLTKNQSIIVFPNPSTGIFYLNGVDSNFERIEVFNEIGELVLNQNITSDNFKINLSHKNPGLYMVRFIHGSNSIIKKVTVW